MTLADMTHKDLFYSDVVALLLTHPEILKAELYHMDTNRTFVYAKGSDGRHYTLSFNAINRRNDTAEARFQLINPRSPDQNEEDIWEVSASMISPRLAADLITSHYPFRKHYVEF